MRDVVRDERTKLDIFGYGPPGSGKTSFYATFPKTWMIFPAVENGWVTVQNMKPELFYEPGVMPRLTVLESVKDIIDVTNQLVTEINSNSGKYETIVFESLNILIASAIRELAHQYKDIRQLYGTIFDVVGRVFDKVKSLPVNFVVTTHRQLNEETKEGTPNLPGKFSEQVAGMFTNIWYHDSDFKIHTKKFGAWTARSRKPLTTGFTAKTYRDLENVLR